MALPLKTTVEDIEVLCNFLATKPTGATLKEARAIIDEKHLDARKLLALRGWNLIEDAGGKLKVTPSGRAFTRGGQEDRQKILRQLISSCPPYSSIVERAAHRPQDDSIIAVDVASHWHEHFREDVGAAEATLNDQAICFFNLLQGAGLGTLVLGRKGNPTRFDWDREAVKSFGGQSSDGDSQDAGKSVEQQNGSNGEKPADSAEVPATTKTTSATTEAPSLGQAIFLAHGKNKTALEQVKKILGQFSIPCKVAVDEPNLGRPISSKVRETMQLCNCAILIFTADEKFVDKDNNEVWRPSENVVHELGACSYLYGDRVVIIKEDRVHFPSNFRDLGYISFSDGGLDAKAMDILKELIGFGIVKVTT
jgi:predicted nucleotide-binding protein